MLGDQHKHDGVIESVLVTNKKNRFGLGDLYDSGDFGLNLFTEYGNVKYLQTNFNLSK